MAAKYDDLLQELNEERAAALMRISRRLDALIAQLHASRDRIEFYPIPASLAG